MNEYESALSDLSEDWESTAYAQGMNNALDDTSRQAERFDTSFGDESRRSIRQHKRGGKSSIPRSITANTVLWRRNTKSGA